VDSAATLDEMPRRVDVSANIARHFVSLLFVASDFLSLVSLVYSVKSDFASEEVIWGEAAEETE
jgi:hypothetical protein